MNDYKTEAETIWKEQLSKVDSWDTLYEVHAILEKELRNVGYLTMKKYSMSEILDKIKQLEE